MSTGLLDQILGKIADEHYTRTSASGTSTTDAGGYVLTGVPVSTTIPTHVVVNGGRTGLVAAITIGGMDQWCIRVINKDTFTLCTNTSVSWYLGYLTKP